MKTILPTALLAAILLAGCGSLPQPTGKVRVCIPDSGFCHFEERR